MKKTLWLLSVGTLALGAGALVLPRAAMSAPGVVSWQGDTVHSSVLFKIKHLGTSWTWGRFDDFTASVETDAAGAALAGVSFSVKTGSVDTGNAKRDTHLKSPDFFNAQQFPDITFSSTAVKAAGDGAWDVTGDLSLHGEKKPVTVRVTKVGAGKGMQGEELLGLEATFSVKRSDFGMANMVGPVGDDVAVTVSVEAAKK